MGIELPWVRSAVTAVSSLRTALAALEGAAPRRLPADGNSVVNRRRGSGALQRMFNRASAAAPRCHRSKFVTHSARDAGEPPALPGGELDAKRCMKAAAGERGRLARNLARHGLSERCLSRRAARPAAVKDECGALSPQ